MNRYFMSSEALLCWKYTEMHYVCGKVSDRKEYFAKIVFLTFSQRSDITLFMTKNCTIRYENRVPIGKKGKEIKTRHKVLLCKALEIKMLTNAARSIGATMVCFCRLRVLCIGWFCISKTTTTETSTLHCQSQPVCP